MPEHQPIPNPESVPLSDRERVNQLGLFMFHQVQAYFDRTATELDYDFIRGKDRNEIHFNRTFSNPREVNPTAEDELSLLYFTVSHHLGRLHCVSFKLKSPKGHKIELGIDFQEHDPNRISASVHINNPAYVEDGYNGGITAGLTIEITDRDRFLSAEEKALQEDPQLIDDFLKEHSGSSQNRLTGRKISTGWANICAQIYANSREMSTSTLQAFYTLFEHHIS